jgi:hypothetical protein
MSAFLKSAKRLDMKRLGKEGKHVFTTLLKKVITVFLIAFLTSTLLLTYFTPKVAASPIAITISSPSGYVGDQVRVIGTIDAINGTYKIFFDGELVTNGTASPQKAVNTTFLIPHRFKGDHAVTIHDVSANTTSAPVYFTVRTNYYINAIMPSQQTQFMESQSAKIRLNVTGGEENNPPTANVTVMLPLPVGTIYYGSPLQLVNTTRLGEYMAETTYPKDFGPHAHINYTGTYNVFFNILNVTRAVGSFTVGLTKVTQYHRFETVTIQGANYTQQNERVWINITSAGKTVFSTNVPAIEGIVNANWTIPWNATYEAYNVTVTSSTSPKTIKPIRDTQIFTIFNATFQCWVRVKNLDNETVSGVDVYAYNGTKYYYSISDNSGLAKLLVEAYTYSFIALTFSGVLVANVSNVNVGRNINQTLVCQLANIKLFIKDKAENPLPFISIDLKYNYTRVDGTKVSDTRTLETNGTGIGNFPNTFINTSYIIEAKRYGYIFNTTSIGNLTASQWINITCPTYTLFIHVVDSKEIPLSNMLVNVTEWSSGLLIRNKSWVTDDRGSTSLNLTFGRYKIKIYNYSAELGNIVALNETIADLTEDRMFEEIHCKIVNLSPSILVVDYFGQPIPNAEIRIERLSEIKQDWIGITSPLRTDANGVASLPSIGGEYSISIYMLGRLSDIKSFYIDETRMLVFKIDKYITIAGLVLETNQLVVGIALGLLVISLIIALTYKKILQKITNRLLGLGKK